MEKARNYDLRYPVTTFAVRLKDRNGWFLDDAYLEYSQIEEQFRQRENDVVEVRKIDEQWLLHRGSGDTSCSLQWWADWSWKDWRYDPLVEAWRAPGEPFAKSVGTLEQIDDLMLRTDPIEVGWCRQILRVGEKSVELWASHVFDPLPSLLDWLERIVRREDTRMLIDEEGCFHGLYNYETGDRARVRLIVVGFMAKLEIEIDASVPRRKLVRAFYDVLRGIDFSDPKQRREWFGGSLEDMSEEDFYSTRSPILDAYLAGLDDPG